MKIPESRSHVALVLLFLTAGTDKSIHQYHNAFFQSTNSLLIDSHVLGELLQAEQSYLFPRILGGFDSA